MQELFFEINKNVIKSNVKYYSQFGRLFYPIKTNDNFEVLKIIDKYLSNEDGYLISSRSNFEMLRFCGISPDRMIYINAISSFEVRNELYNNGVRSFVFGDIYNFKKFCFRHRDINIYLRLALSDNDIGMSKKEFEKCVEWLKNNGIKFNVELYFTRDSKNNHESILNNYLEYLKSFEFNEINIGGLNEKLLPNNANLEIGENLLKGAINCKTKLLLKKNDKIYLESGIYSGMLDVVLYNKRFDIIFEDIKVSDSYSDYYNKSILICGGSCDSKDILGVYYINCSDFDKLYNGMDVTILDTGAYFNVFNMSYASDIQKVYKVVGG